MSNKKKKPENFLRRLLNQQGDFAYYTYEQLFGDGPPKMDMMMSSRLPDGFSPEQRAALADGLKQTQAKRIALGLVYFENESELPFVRMMMKGILYRNTFKLKQGDLQLVLLYQKEPLPVLLADLGYQPASRPGVYQTSVPILSDILVIVLSELSNALYNAGLKIFARSQKARSEAYNVMLNHGSREMPPGMRMALTQLATLTEDEMDGAGVDLQEALLSQLGDKSKSGAQDPLAALSPEEVIRDVEEFLRQQR